LRLIAKRDPKLTANTAIIDAGLRDDGWFSVEYPTLEDWRRDVVPELIGPDSCPRLNVSAPSEVENRRRAGG
jgi:hypothetical protein